MRSRETCLILCAAAITFIPGFTFQAAASEPSAGGVTFQDIAAGDGAGITYRRRPSPSKAIFDRIKQEPTYSFPDLSRTPFKSRGAPGVAIFDFDRDGDLDLYVTNGPGAANSLYANQLRETGALAFVDLAAAAGVAAADQDSTGVCYGDLDNDGDHDLLVLGNLEPARLFENRGDGTFADLSAASGIEVVRRSAMSCTLGDVDGDGLLDIAVANAFDLSEQSPIFVEFFAGNQPNQLLRNLGSNRFEDVSLASGILDLDLPPQAPQGAATITWAIALVDLDLDGDLDLLHADDQAALPHGGEGGLDRGYVQIFENDGSGRFTNVNGARAMRRPGAWMGLAFGDFDRDGRLDLFATNTGNYAIDGFRGAPGTVDRDSRWFLQQGDGTFFDPLDQGVLNTPFGWGTSAADYDNDGDTDILFHGGADFGPLVVTAPGVILDNDGRAGFRRDAAALAGSTDHVRRTVHGMAVGDLDEDGFIDIVSVSNFDFPAPIPLTPAVPLGGEFDVDAFHLETFIRIDPENFIFRFSGIDLPDDGTLAVEVNRGGNGNRWLKVEARGTVGLTSGGRVNRDGIGAVLRVTPHGGEPVLQPVLGGSSYASQDSLIATLGLGRAAKATVEVLWPGGVRNRLHDVPAGSRVLFPEIPCSFDDRSLGFPEYHQCVTTALDQLVAAGVLDHGARGRFLASAIRAFHEAR